MSPIRTSLLLAAPRFQIRNLPIANLHRRKKRLQIVRYFRASSGRVVFATKCFTAFSASKDVSHIGSIVVVSSEVRVKMMKIVRKQTIICFCFNGCVTKMRQLFQNAILLLFYFALSSFEFAIERAMLAGILTFVIIFVCFVCFYCLF